MKKQHSINYFNKLLFFITMLVMSTYSTAVYANGFSFSAISKSDMKATLQPVVNFYYSDIDTEELKKGIPDSPKEWLTGFAGRIKEVLSSPFPQREVVEEKINDEEVKSENKQNNELNKSSQHETKVLQIKKKDKKNN